MAGWRGVVIRSAPSATYKPDHRAYQVAIDAFRLEREEMRFVAFAGWDAAGGN
jgi:2-haloacid dehalogenase